MWGRDILVASHFGRPWDVGNDHSFLTHRNFKRSARAHGWGQELAQLRGRSPHGQLAAKSPSS